MQKIYALHGWAYSTEKWGDFISELKGLKIDLELIPIPGLTADLDDPWNIDDYIAWLEETLPNEPVVLLGHSNGGRLALNFAWVYPERVKHLILLDSAGVPPSGSAKLKRDAFRIAAKAGKLASSNPKLRKVVHKVARVNDYHDAPEHMKVVMSNMLKSDDSLNLTEIQTKTDIIWGGNDKTTPLQAGVKMKHDLPNSRFHIIEGARHSPHFTHIGEVAQILKAIL